MCIRDRQIAIGNIIDFIAAPFNPASYIVGLTGAGGEIMGITESSNRATSEAAQYIYAQNVIMPRLNRREEA